jgi:ABC-type uncharacterized transport system involved in gliding motility auxiliary subunit
LAPRPHRHWLPRLWPPALIAAAAALAVLSLRYQWHWDWTSSGRNSLAPASVELLHSLGQAPRLTAYVRPERLLRRQVEDLVARYQQLRPDIQLEFIDPGLHPDLARELGLTAPVEIEIEYSGRRERITDTSEDSLSNALERLANNRRPWVAGLAGHGERDLMGDANHDLGEFGRVLEAKGFRPQGLNLATTPIIPENVQVLVIAGPATPLLPGEIELVRRYLAAGGNLLWLTDPGEQQGLEPLLQEIGVSLLPGLVVDANVRALGIDDPSFALVSRYPEHPLTEGLQTASLFPKAAAMEARPTGDWQATPLLRTLEASWNETGPLRGEVRRDPEAGERAGPLTLGLALTRRSPGPEGPEQRLAIVGDGDFLSNAYLGNAGNLELGLRLLRWLSREDRMLKIPPRLTPSPNLELSPFAAKVIGLGFLFGLPLLLSAAGAVVWWRRRRS